MLSINSIAYSQKMELDENNDTTICISVDEAKFLLQSYYDLQKTNEYLIICEEKSSYKDSLISSLKTTCFEQDSIIKNESDMLEFRKNESIKLSKRVQYWYGKYNAQIAYKNIFMASTIILSLFSGGLYITKN